MFTLKLGLLCILLEILGFNVSETRSSRWPTITSNLAYEYFGANSLQSSEYDLIYCNGLAGCSNTNNIQGKELYCRGSHSCYNSYNVSIGTDHYCDGVLSCAFIPKLVIGVFINCQSQLSCYSTTIDAVQGVLGHLGFNYNIYSTYIHCSGVCVCVCVICRIRSTLNTLSLLTSV